MLAEAAAFPRDLPALGAADAVKRNALARLDFEAVEITDDRVVAVAPHPGFAPSFLARAAEKGVVAENENGAAS